MKYIFSLAIVTLFPCSILISQSTIKRIQVTDHKNGKTYQVFKVEQMDASINDEKYDRAINQQLGIIGNDYFTLDTIGITPAEEKNVKDTWYPIALDRRNRLSFKTTSVGVIKEKYRRSPSASADFGSSLFVGKEADDDWNFDVIQQGIILPKIDMYGNQGDIRHDIVRYEIDIPDSFKDFFAETKEYTPAIFTPFAAYGPLVTDQGHGPPYGIEIHPSEQMWWTKQLPEKVLHYLFSFSDASGRFNDRGSYDARELIGTSPTWRGMWQESPQESIFAIPFLTKKKQTEKITVKEITRFEKGEMQTETHNSNYFLVFKKDTILNLKYIGSTNVEFDINNFGFDPYYMLKNNDTIYKGFVIMKSVIATAGGHQVYKIERENKNQHLEQTPQYTYSYDIKIKTITCEDLGDDAFSEEKISEKSIELTGAIGIISQGIKQNIGATIPLMNNNILAQYTNKIFIKKNETRNLNIKRNFKIHENEEFYLFAFLKESSDWVKLDPVNQGFYISEPGEEINTFGTTVRGAEFNFYKIGIPKEFSILAEGSHGTKIKLKGSITVTNKQKIIPKAVNLNAVRK